jgi:salicylate 5-hydroxylase small subunit
VTVPLVDHHAITEMYRCYADTLDEGPIEQWPEFFIEDASYRVIPRSNADRGLSLATMWCKGRPMMIDRVNALTSANFFLSRRIRHLIGPLGVTPLEGSESTLRRWRVTATFAVYETLALEPTRLIACGRYDDIVEEQPDGRILIADKRCLNDADLVANSLVYPF